MRVIMKLTLELIETLVNVYSLNVEMINKKYKMKNL